MLTALKSLNEEADLIRKSCIADPLLGIKEIVPGVYETHMQGEFLIWGTNAPYISAYFDLPGDISSYGTCDGWENLKEVIPSIVDGPEKYTVFLMPVIKSEQYPKGGWRWHKWGEYIGKHTPTMEYLYDEPLIDKVYCYHIYKVGETTEDSK